MNHKGTQIIETEHFILRPFTIKDVGAVYRNWASDPEVVKYLTWGPHKSIDESEEYVLSCLSGYNDRKNFYNWAIVLKEIDEPIGSIGAAGTDESRKKVEVGYGIGKTWWNKGYMTEVLGAVIDYFFNEIEYNRVEAKHDTENIASGKVMRRCGLEYEGRQKESELNNRGIIDVDLYGLTYTDYKNSKSDKKE